MSGAKANATANVDAAEGDSTRSTQRVKVIFAETPECIDSHGTAHYSGVVLIFVPKGGTLAPEVALI